MWWVTAGNIAVLWGHWLGQQYDRKRWSTLSCRGAGMCKMAASRVASLDLVMSSGAWRWASAPSSRMVLARSEAADLDWMLEAAGGGLTVGCAFTLATLDLAVRARVPGAWVGIDNNDGMLLVATTFSFSAADPCLCLGSALGVALVLPVADPCLCLGSTLDITLAIDFGFDLRAAKGVVVVQPRDGTFMMDVRCGSGTKDNKLDSMRHCSKTSTHVGGQ